MVNDIILENYDLKIVDGDFLVAPSDKQHTDLIIRTSQGDWKFTPLLGVGIIKDLASPTSGRSIEARITKQLISDSYKVQLVRFTGGLDKFEIALNAERIEVI